MTRAQHGFIEPTIDSDSAIWWDALQQRTIALQQCGACGRLRCPLPSCPYCGAADSALVSASGKGTIYSWVTVHRSLAPEFAGDEPYTILAVTLAEGPRVFARLLRGQPAAGLEVAACFYTVRNTTLLGFEPVGLVQ